MNQCLRGENFSRSRKSITWSSLSTASPNGLPQCTEGTLTGHTGSWWDSWELQLTPFLKSVCGGGRLIAISRGCDDVGSFLGLRVF